MKRLLAFVPLVLCLFGSCTFVSEQLGLNGSDDWCIFRGSSSLSGYTDCRLPEEPQLQWTFRADVRTVASPIVCGGICYTCDRKGMLRGINQEGQLCFGHDLGTLIESNFILQDSTLYIGRLDGFITALTLGGRERWQFETEGQISASPNTVDMPGGRQILVGSYDNYMYALDAESGKEINRFETGYYINGATALSGQYMVFGGCDAWFRVVDTQSGIATDSMELRAYIPASPVVMDDCVYVADYMGNLYEFRLEEGRIASHRMLVEVDGSSEESGGLIAMPVVTEDAVYVFSQGRYLTSISRKDGTERWRVMLRGDVGESSPLVCRDRLLVCTKDGHVSILSTSDGAELWHFEAGEQIIASPAVVRGAFYILTARGTLFRFTS